MSEKEGPPLRRQSARGLEEVGEVMAGGRRAFENGQTRRKAGDGPAWRAARDIVAHAKKGHADALPRPAEQERRGMQKRPEWYGTTGSRDKRSAACVDSQDRGRRERTRNEGGWSGGEHGCDRGEGVGR